MPDDQAASGLGATTIGRFRSALSGRVLRPDDDGYEAARRVFNGLIDRRPALIAQCATPTDVMRAVEFARDNALLVAVRGGGHSVAGHGACEGGLVIDLSPMKSIRVDPGQKTARTEAGLRWGDFDREAARFGLATTGGEISTTGISGLTLGGGLGWLMRKYGLACDNVQSVELVTADSRRVTANDGENPDLFWGVRGGGGNFGIVTAFEWRLHPVERVLGGMVLHPLAQAREVLRAWRDLLPKAPDELTSNVAFVTSPDGEVVLALVVCCVGSLEAAERLVRPFRAIGSPLADLIRPMTYAAEMQTLLDAAFPAGRRHYWKACFLAELADDTIDTIVDNVANVTSPHSAVLIEHLEGAVGRVGRDETAFDGRDAKFSFGIFSSWEGSDGTQRHIDWTRDYFNAMKRFGTERAYVNYLVDDERVRRAYGEAKYARLLALKRKYDSGNLFRLNQNIAP
jgi:FAD binding domain/Berberine and berberine like